MNLPTAAKEEPPTSGKIIFFTTQGDIEIELWSREAPLACRNFIQHCTNGYYNNTIFHRLIPSFMIQGGDPTGTGTGGQSIYGEPFRDEFNQRLRFVRRGIVAMANSGKNTNSSQFFITFGDCEHLNKKHTIFGKVVGDTIYNLMAMQSIDTDANDRPNEPPSIKRSKVVLNPFDDIVQFKKQVKQQETKEKKIEIAQKTQQQKKQQLKKLKKKSKLTFDCDEVEEGSYKVKSSHDILKDTHLSSQLALNTEDLAQKLKEKIQEQRKRQQMKKKIQASAEGDGDQNPLLAQQLHKKRKLNEQNGGIIQDQILNYQTVFNPQTQRKEITWDKAKIQEENEQQKLKAIKEMQKKEFQGMVADELNFKKLKEGSRKQKRKILLSQQIELLSNAERIRYEFLKKNQQEKIEVNLFQKLNSFTAKLKDPSAKGNNWMKHQLKFHIDSENAYKLDEKKRLVHQQQEDLEDGGLKIEVDKTEPLNAQFNVDQLYDMIHNQDMEQEQK